MLRVLFLGDVVGRPGRTAVERYLRGLAATKRPGLVVANAENASGGRGIDPATAEALQDMGVDVLTTGNHVWQSREIGAYLADTSRVLRPANYPPGCPGVGWTVVQSRGTGPPVAVVNLVGRVFMGLADCPFRAAETALEAIGERARVVVVDMHGEATSEKVAMGRFLDGRVSAVIGTHTHVQTADEDVLPGGTAYLTDAGMCGPADSVLGVRTDRVVERFLTQIPNRFDVAGGPVLVQGAVVVVDPATGRAQEIHRVRERIAA
jgi:metallophosphoesterase (TIGR00282 family)